MSDETSRADFGAGRHIPAAVDPSLKGIPEDAVSVDMMPEHELNWLQSIRQNEVPEDPQARSDSNLEERAAEVWAVVEELEETETVQRSQASD